MLTSWADYFYDHFVRVEDYKEIRPDILDLFEELYEQPEATEYREKVESPQLKQQALSAHNLASDYIPAEALTNLRNVIQRVRTLFTVTFFILIITSTKLSYDALRQISLDALSLGDAVLSLSILPPTVMAIVGIYLYAISANQTIIQRFNEDLKIPPGRIHGATRNDSRLFAFLIWNRSLSGSRMHIGLGVLNVIRTASPRFYDFILSSITRNADVFLSGKGIIAIVRELYRRHRGKKTEADQEATEEMEAE